MSNKNQFYNTRNFVLIRVKFSDEGKRYTYIAHIKHRVKVGDWVTVPTGDKENVFDVVGGYRDIQTVEVTGITTDMCHLPKDFDIKLIIGNVSHTKKNYQGFYQAKVKYGLS